MSETKLNDLNMHCLSQISIRLLIPPVAASLIITNWQIPIRWHIHRLKCREFYRILHFVCVSWSLVIERRVNHCIYRCMISLPIWIISNRLVCHIYGCQGIVLQHAMFCHFNKYSEAFSCWRRQILLYFQSIYNVPKLHIWSLNKSRVLLQHCTV
jgi:hypothetical protein